MSEMDLDELRERLEPHVADHSTDEGQQAIQDAGTGGNVKEIWEDGEVTSTKGGKVFRKRTLHRRKVPFLEEDLWEVPENRKHNSMVVIDEKALEILSEAREIKRGN